MATSQTASIHIIATASTTKNGRTGGGNIDSNLQFDNGTLANKADKAYYDRITIAASGSPAALDFAGGGLIDLNGDAITWVEMVGLVVSAPSTNGQNVLVGAHANALEFGIGTTATIQVRPGETKVLIGLGADPAYVVTAGSADTLKAAIASGTNQDLEVLAIGRSA